MPLMGKVPISDATISRNVSRQLASSGLRSPCRIQVQTRNGEVTLSGTVQFVHQRNTAVQSIRTVEGVRRIVEKLKVTPPAKHQYPQPTAASKKEPVSDEAQAVPGDGDAAPPIPEPPLPANEPTQVEAAGDASAMLVTEVDFDATSMAPDSAPQESAPRISAGELRVTRSGDSHTFECSSNDDAERLRVLLAGFADWLKKNSWVGTAKQTGDLHLVTFHAKSLIEYLRQQGF
jgi:hypothetical protein